VARREIQFVNDIDVRFRSGRLSVITGISGSGKSMMQRGNTAGGVRAAEKKDNAQGVMICSNWSAARKEIEARSTRSINSKRS